MTRANLLSLVCLLSCTFLLASAVDSQCTSSIQRLMEFANKEKSELANHPSITTFLDALVVVDIDIKRLISECAADAKKLGESQCSSDIAYVEQLYQTIVTDIHNGGWNVAINDLNTLIDFIPQLYNDCTDPSA